MLPISKQAAQDEEMLDGFINNMLRQIESFAAGSYS